MKHISIIFLLILLFSCTSRDKSNNEGITYTIKLADNQKTDLKYSDIIDVQKWIALDTLNECIIGDVAKIEDFNKEYYVLDKTIQKCVLVFDEHGKYLRRIGKCGQGPGEYVQIYDFTINKKTGCIVILTGLSKVYLYSLEGEFKMSKQVSKSLLWNIASNDCGYLMSSNHNTYTEGENAYLLYAFDSDFNLTGRWVHVLPEQMPTLPLLSSTLQTVGNEVYCCDAFTNSIYTYNCDVDSVIKKYNKLFSVPMPDHIFANVMDFMEKQRDYDFISEVVINEDNMLLGYIHQGRYNLAIIGSDGSIVRNGQYSGHFPKTFHGSNKELLSPISADEYLTYWEKLPVTHYNGIISPESNFMILKWTMK